MRSLQRHNATLSVQNVFHILTNDKYFSAIFHRAHLQLYLLCFRTTRNR